MLISFVLGVGLSMWHCKCDEDRQAASEADNLNAGQPGQAGPAEQQNQQYHSQSAFGLAIEKAKATDCIVRLKDLHGFWAAEKFLPTSAKDFKHGASALKCPDDGADYEILVSGEVRNAGKVPVLRCPTHKVTICADGTTLENSASEGTAADKR